jgi:hypothetical protein
MQPALAEVEDHLAAGRAGGEEELALNNFAWQVFPPSVSGTEMRRCGLACQVRQETSSASLGPPQSPVLQGGRGFLLPIITPHRSENSVSARPAAGLQTTGRG